MVQHMAIETAKKMSEHSVIDSKTIHIYAYGLELLFSSLAGVVAMIIISTAWGEPFLWVPYLAGFIPLRLSGGGYHAKTHFRCIFTFSLLYCLVLLIEKMCLIPARIWSVACSVNLATIFFFSPVAAPNKPLKEWQSKTNRRNSLFWGLINLLGCVVLVFLLNTQNQWANMYFTGSSMAGLSMLLAVINNQKGRGMLHENIG